MTKGKSDWLVDDFQTGRSVIEPETQVAPAGAIKNRVDDQGQAMGATP